MRNAQTGVLVVCVVLGCFSDCGGAVRISECSQAGWMEIGEDDGQSANITCVDIPANATVRWEVSIGTASQGAATCGPTGRNCTHRVANLAASRPSDTSSVLTIVDNLRTKVGNGSVLCAILNHTTGSFSCDTNVITPAPPLSPCNLEVNVTDWTVAGTCRFERAFSSNGTYTCTWRQHHNQSLPDKTMAGVVEKTEQRLSNKTYYSGTCSFTSLLATRVSEGEYSYSVQFYPGSGTATVGTLRVDIPGQPRTNCSQYVYEGQDVLCHCLPNASTPGSPPPALPWQGHSAGSPLDLRDVRRDRSGHVFVCTLLWGPPSDRVTKHVNYTLEVAYGPDDVTVTRRQDGQTVESQFLTLVCTVTGVYPSAVVTWTGVKCASAPNSTGETDDNVCRFQPAQEDDGKVVTCVASNSVFPDHLVRNATYQIELRAPAKPGASKGNIGGDDLPLGPIVGGTVAAVAVVVVVVLVVVIVKRQRRKKPADTRQLENRTENDSDVEEHVNPVYGSGDVDAAPKPRPKPAGVALRIPSNINSARPATATVSEETVTASEETATASEEIVTATGNGSSPTEENATRTEQNAAEERSTATDGNPTESNDRAIQNNATEPNTTEPNARAIENNVTEPKATELNVTEPNATQPNATQPNATGIEDNATEPNNTAAEEIKEQDNLLEDELDMGYSTVSFGRKQTATSGDGKGASTSSRPSQGVSLVPASSDPPSGPPAPPDHAEIGVYESVDMEPPSPSRSPHVRSAGPSANTLLGDVNNQASCLPEEDVYAVVSKSRPRTYPGPSSISATDPESGWEDEDHTYAVVDKKSSRSNAGAASVASPEPNPGEDHTSQSESSADIYAQVDKSTKRGNSSPSGEPAEEPEVELYAQVQKPKPAVKPKPTVKPTPPQKPTLPEGVDREETGTVEALRTTSDYDDIAASEQGEMVQNTTGDDVYNKLSYSKQTSLPEPTDPDPQYSHIGHV